ncbi:recombinase family protein [Pseudomonadota bacterium]|nr:recombinase family protein [Pseudomonadota bacterium]
MAYLDCYVRVSTKEQADDGDSLDNQIAIGKKVAKKLGLQFRLRNEGAKSSTTVTYRDELEALKQDIKDGKANNIWALDRSRMFRDMIESMVFRSDYLVKHKAKLFEGAFGAEVNFRDENEMLTYDILARLQQYENKLRSERSERGKIQKLKKAVTTDKPVFLGGTALFGYKSENKFWVIEKDEAKWVKQIYTNYENGKTVKEIANELNNNNIKPRRAKLWNLVTLQKMLRNETYTGVNKVKIKKLDNKEFTYKVPPIITVSQYKRVQKIMDAKLKTNDRNRKYESLLSGLLECECGTVIGSEVKRLVNKEGRQINTKKYYCVNKLYEWRDGKKRNCNNTKSLDMDNTNEAVLKIIKKTVSDSNLLKEQFKKDVLDNKADNKKEVAEKRKILEQKCQRIQKQIVNIEDMIVELEVEKGLGKKEQNIANKVIGKYETELEAQNNEYKLVEQELENLDSELVWVDWLDKFADSTNVKLKTYEQQRNYLKGLVDKIIVKAVMGEDRNGNEKQIGHSFDIVYKRKIVGDKIEYVDAKNKRKGYKVVAGKNLHKTSLLSDVTAKAGRKWQKKR